MGKNLEFRFFLAFRQNPVPQTIIGMGRVVYHIRDLSVEIRMQGRIWGGGADLGGGGGRKPPSQGFDPLPTLRVPPLVLFKKSIFGQPTLKHCFAFEQEQLKNNDFTQSPAESDTSKAHPPINHKDAQNDCKVPKTNGVEKQKPPTIIPDCKIDPGTPEEESSI